MRRSGERGRTARSPWCGAAAPRGRCGEAVPRRPCGRRLRCSTCRRHGRSLREPQADAVRPLAGRAARPAQRLVKPTGMCTDRSHLVGAAALAAAASVERLRLVPALAEGERRAGRARALGVSPGQRSLAVARHPLTHPASDQPATPSGDLERAEAGAEEGAEAPGGTGAVATLRSDRPSAPSVLFMPPRGLRRRGSPRKRGAAGRARLTGAFRFAARSGLEDQQPAADGKVRTGPSGAVHLLRRPSSRPAPVRTALPHDRAGAVRCAPGPRTSSAHRCARCALRPHRTRGVMRNRMADRWSPHTLLLCGSAVVRPAAIGGAGVWPARHVKALRWG